MSAVEAAITAVAHGGEGIARIDGEVCFVAGALPGDVARLELTGKRRGVRRGRLVELIEPSPDRIEAGCPAFGRCGGCSWLHFAYPAQGAWKRRIVVDCLARIARVAADVRWVDDPALRLAYRTRARFHGDASGWGFYERGSRSVCPITACPLCHPSLNDAFARLQRVPGRGSVELTVDPAPAPGFRSPRPTARSFIPPAGGNDKGGPHDSPTAPLLAWTPEPVPGLTEAFPGVQVGRKGPRQRFVFDGVPVVNGCFSQASLLLNRLLRAEVERAVGDAASVLDAYCGSGNLSLPLAGDRDVAGFDRDPAAVEAAGAMGRGAYHVGDEAAMAHHLTQRGFDAIVLDPPRAGAKALMPALRDAPAGRIVYVSCDPATLARDAKTLLAAGWRLADAAAVDLFPQTPHVEAVATFIR